jgi:hypothetical protein
MAQEFNSGDDFIDVRDVIARYEELETEIEDDTDGTLLDERDESTLNTLLSNLKGIGGDEQWRGDWYPITMIRDSYFEDYARELALADDCGMIPKNARWPNTHIDWEAAVNELKMDYASVEYDDVTYWVR